MLVRATLQLDDKIHPLENDGIGIPRNIVKMITREIGRKQGHILIKKNTDVPDSFYPIDDSQIIIPISNETKKKVRLSNDVNILVYQHTPRTQRTEKLYHYREAQN